ncbi:MAG: SulP family inorganic anion transporter, partial [Gemmatimonadetes bacterium]
MSAAPGAALGPTPPDGRISTRDLVAGVSVALVLVPQALAYAELAGLPGRHGLYAAAVAPVAAAFLASSPYLQTGPVALTALLTFGALVPLAAPGTAAYAGLAALLALVVGVVRTLVGLLRAGRVSYLMSGPMLDGFTTGAAVLIVASQLPGALGLSRGEAGVLGGAWSALGAPGSWDPAALGLSAVTVGLVLGARRVHPLIPGVLLATGLGIGFSVFTGYEGARLGDIPRALPHVELNLPWEALPGLLVPGVVIALVGFAEAASIGRLYAARDHLRWDPDREFLGQGVANLASGLFAGMPVGGSFARSGLSRLAGARTRWTGLVAGLAVLAFLPFATLLAPLPRAVLAAIVIAAVSGLVRLRRMVELWRLSKPQGGVAWLTFALCLLFSPHVEWAVVAGMGASLAVHAWREMNPGLRAWQEGGVLHLVPSGVLWFGSANSLEEAMLAALASGRPSEVVVHL